MIITNSYTRYISTHREKYFLSKMDSMPSSLYRFKFSVVVYVILNQIRGLAKLLFEQACVILIQF